MWHILKRASLVWILSNCYNQIKRTQRNVLHIIIKFGFQFIWSILNKGFKKIFAILFLTYKAKSLSRPGIRNVNWILKLAGDHQRCYFILSATGMEMLAFVSASFSQNDEWHLGYLARASYQIRKIADCACAGIAVNVFPVTDFNGKS